MDDHIVHIKPKVVATGVWMPAEIYNLIREALSAVEWVEGEYWVQCKVCWALYPRDYPVDQRQHAPNCSIRHALATIKGLTT